MKNAIISLALLVASIGANATSLHPDTFAQVANMKIIKMDRNFGAEIVRAQVYVNHVTKIARLTLKQKSICSARPGQMNCLAIAPDLVVELPIVSVRKDGCGSSIIVARRNAMPVDGALEQLTISDHRTMTCKTFVALPGATEVELKTQFYNRMTGGLITKESYLAGEALRNMFAR
ncbi:MAG: hypothetical protein ABL958_08095 [Bdellovibrionia bacterium]